MGFGISAILTLFQGIQQPLRERYPVEDTPETRGIDSWLGYFHFLFGLENSLNTFRPGPEEKTKMVSSRLSVWSNGILLEYVEGEQKSETAFFPINTLHYCAAVRFVNVTGFSVEG